MNNIKRERIKKVVSDLLTKASIKTLPVQVEEIAKTLNLQIKKSPYHGKNNLSGVLIRNAHENIIGINSNDIEHRQRFSIAHEIGHFLLHEGNQIYVDRKYRVNFRNKKSTEGTDIQEIEANTFASMLLIPEEFLLNDLKKFEIDFLDSNDIEKLVSRYNVSSAAMSFRLSRINV